MASSDGQDETAHYELQIRGGIEDNSKIMFLISQQNIFCDSSLELSL